MIDQEKIKSFLNSLTKEQLEKMYEAFSGKNRNSVAEHEEVDPEEEAKHKEISLQELALNTYESQLLSVAICDYKVVDVYDDKDSFTLVFEQIKPQGTTTTVTVPRSCGYGLNEAESDKIFSYLQRMKS
ncbi:hypothetical protein HC141_03100 [Lactobacillus mulieris]|uniref:hypothetical protein n=1 Tax=Lactobacillus mulieris TaxID=2508708 RepID=UPI0014329BD2|nr:hypothetical protein [Lactobacillus mulieris]MDK6563808.1 hypothetical protein [Lactobacillus mulieris]MDK8082852.1 hypothetical protein [Lactobacillus mulieris]NKC42929.1 hypothetical protein [Lactobacillus mulieris]